MSFKFWIYDTIVALYPNEIPPLVNAEDNLQRQMETAYSEPHRHYHTIDHINSCLATAKRTKHLCDNPEEVMLAIWFHDFVYDTKADDNEEQSAYVARDILCKTEISKEQIGRITNMILATKTHIGNTKDEKILLDIDIQILGTSPHRFEKYDRQIREEYSWVPEEQYREGRKKILASFLNRPFIYSTDEFQIILENQARENLKRKIDEL